jgi:hypothetical protein
VLANFRCNFTLKASGTDLESSRHIDTPGSNATSSSHACLESVMSFWSAKDTVLKNEILNFNLINSASLRSGEEISEKDNVI